MSIVEIPRLLKEGYSFPSPNKANIDGLLAWGGDLSTKRLLHAYRNGIFPWYSKEDPLLWWSPDPRLLLFPDEFRVTKSLKKSKAKFNVKFNVNFQEVIALCSDLREDTWIDKNMKKAYLSLFKDGYAKSVECYQDDKLVGGLYGLQIGSVFCGESMFSVVSDASKVALWELCRLIGTCKGSFIDCQMPTKHLISLGAKVVKREKFLRLLQENRDKEISIW